MKLGTAIRRVLGVNAGTYSVSLEYEDGWRGTADLRHLFAAAKPGPLVAEILRGDLFARCFVESGALAWPNGYELCPDAVRSWMQQRRAVSSQRSRRSPGSRAAA
ncbi:MAG: DUF2442 domain-containing protein [Deltaproteobacteria bacterium]|nr:DUF2442 domain-containing protein [Deltaproteobacteria bacterium]